MRKDTRLRFKLYSKMSQNKYHEKSLDPMCKSCRTGSFRAKNNTTFLNILNSLRFLTRIFPVNWELILVFTTGRSVLWYSKECPYSKWLSNFNRHLLHQSWFPYEYGASNFFQSLSKYVSTLRSLMRQNYTLWNLKICLKFRLLCLARNRRVGKETNTQKGPWSKQASDLRLIVSRQEM